MHKTLSLLALTSAVLLAAPAFAEEKTTYESKTKISQDSDTYKKKEEVTSKGPEGKTSVTAKTTVDVDADGDVEETMTTKAVDDPKGLGNKTKTETKDVVKHDKKTGMTTTEHKKEVDGKTVEHTKSGDTTTPPAPSPAR